MGLDISFHKTKNKYFSKKINSEEFDFIYDNEQFIYEFRKEWNLFNILKEIDPSVSELHLIVLSKNDIDKLDNYEIYSNIFDNYEFNKFINSLKKSIQKSEILVLISY